MMMQRILTIGPAVALLVALTAPVTRAEEPAKVYKTVTTEETVTKQGYDKIGVGASLLMDTVLPSATALNFLLGFGEKDLLQVHFSIPGSSPVQLTAAGVWKHTVHQEALTGFHIGGGVALGLATSVTNTATSDFYATIIGIAGMHFRFKELPKIEFNVDAGPNLTLGSGRNNFRVGFAGIGISYFF